MSRVHASLVAHAIALLTLACRRDPSVGTTPPPGPTTPLADAPVAEPALGPEGDLKARGAFRAEASKGAMLGLANRWLTLTIQTQAIDGSWWALAAGGQLRTGEVLVTEVELQRPAHVYVINVSASGKSVLLYPDERFEQDALLGKGTHRLPPMQSERPYVELDAEVGTEHIFVIATLEPIARTDTKLADLVTKLLQGESPMLPSGREPPRRKPKSTGGANAADRSSAKGSNASGSRWTQEEIDRALTGANVNLVPGLKSRGTFRSRRSGAAVDAQAGADGVVVIPFRFEHI